MTAIPIKAKGNPSSQIWVIGEAPGSQEERLGLPFVGPSGLELEKMLGEAHLPPRQCFFDNVCRYRPPNNDISEWISTRKTPPAGWKHFNGKWVHPYIFDGIQQLLTNIALHKPALILALGNTALWALTDKWGITNWRGSQINALATKIVPTYHPAAILRNWEWRAIAVQDFRRAYDWFLGGREPPVWSRDIVRDYTDWRATFPILRDSPLLSVDIETRRGQIICVGIAWSKTQSVCVPLLKVGDNGSAWTFREETLIRQDLEMLLTNPDRKILGQNFSYDSAYFVRQMGFMPNHDFDTMIAQHVAFAGMPKALHFLASMYCDHYVYWKEDGKYWDPKTTSLDELLWYCCEDTMRTFEVHEVLFETIKKLKLASVYAFQMALTREVNKMSLRGIRVDQALRAQVLMDILDAGSALSSELETLAGVSVNPKSSKQVQELLYQGFNIPPKRHRKTHQITVDDDTLTELGMNHPPLRCLTERITALRSLGVFSSTFLEAPLDVDGRIRCSFNTAKVETYRFSSSTSPFGIGLNMQNIPGKEHELPGGWKLPNLRKMFVPDPGYIIFDCDLQSADAQVVAAEANDQALLQMYREGVDVHSENAKAIYGACDGKDDPRRFKAKTGVHATNYGTSPRTLARALGCTILEAEQFQKNWFGAHPGIKRWHEDVKHQLQSKRMVENKFGYRRFYFDRVDSLLPQALAWIPQSTVAIVINKVLMNIATSIPEAQLLIQVHDSLVFQVPDTIDFAPFMLKLLCAFNVPIPYTPTLVIGAGVAASSQSWGDVKAWSWTLSKN